MHLDVFHCVPALDDSLKLENEILLLTLGSRVGAVVRALASHQCVPGCVGSLLCSERFFSGNSGFPLSTKTKI